MAGKPEFMRLAGGHCRNGKSPFRALTHGRSHEGTPHRGRRRNGKSPFRALTLDIFSSIIRLSSVEMERARLGR